MIFDARKDPRLAHPDVDVLHDGRSIRDLMIVAADTYSGWCLRRAEDELMPCFFKGVKVMVPAQLMDTVP